MRKILYLLVLLIMISGCEAIYTLEINGDDYLETLEVNNYIPSTWGVGEGSYQDLIKSFASANIPTDFNEKRNLETNQRFPEVNYYAIELINTSANLGIRYRNTFTLSEYRYSNIVNYNFDAFKINKSDKIISFNSLNDTLAFRRYPLLNKLTIKITTNREVLEHNADEIIDNTYYWYLDKNNYENKSIDFQISESFKSNLKLWQTDEDGYFGTSTLVSVYVGFAIVGLGIGIFIYFKVKNSNSL